MKRERSEIMEAVTMLVSSILAAKMTLSLGLGFTLILHTLILPTNCSFASTDYTATNPNPANGETIAPEHLDDNVYMLLDYTPAADWLMHMAYFSDDIQDVIDRDPSYCLGSVPPWPAIDPDAFVVGYDDPGIPEFARAPLIAGRTYYWCIDAFDWAGPGRPDVWMGDIWNFTVMPKEAWGPSPEDDAHDVLAAPNLTFCWSLGDVDTEGYDVSYDVYYGTVFADVSTSTTPNANEPNTTHTTAGPLVPGIEYYWRIDTVLRLSISPFTSSTVIGDIWSFWVQSNTSWHVDAVGGDDLNNGLSHGTAFKTIQKGVDTAEDGNIVLVWPGVYVEQIFFYGKAITVKNADYPAVIEAPWQDAVSFIAGEGPGSVLSNFVIRQSMTAIACNNESSPTLKNLTIIDNDFGIAAYEASDPDITNCILWNNEYGDLFGCEARYSCVETASAGNGNISIYPMFADFGGDYHLLSDFGRYVPAYGLWAFDDETSPCIDAGDPAEDPSGERMPNGGRINMGAYAGTPYASMSEWPLAHDKNKDGRTDFKDLASLCDEWLMELPWAAPPGTPPVDRTPPEPDPATWDIEPYATSLTSILMAATAATDDNGVEYYFENMTIGGHTSGWQDPANWTDSSLASSTEYCYRIKTRDKSPNANESGWSTTLCTMTSSGGR
ncbi:MAG: hypothetical protein JXN61_09995 [Sedimentisphaerales bacterium]|nr:hypothetical protein [Sedimentisphaerales bacterium]